MCQQIWGKVIQNQGAGTCLCEGLYLHVADTLEHCSGSICGHRALVSVRIFADGDDICIQSILLLLLLPKVMDQLEKLKCSKSLGLG